MLWVLYHQQKKTNTIAKNVPINPDDKKVRYKTDYIFL